MGKESNHANVINLAEKLVNRGNTTFVPHQGLVGQQLAGTGDLVFEGELLDGDRAPEEQSSDNFRAHTPLFHSPPVD